MVHLWWYTLKCLIWATFRSYMPLFALIHSLIHSLTRSLARPPARPLAWPLAWPLARPPARSLTLDHSVVALAIGLVVSSRSRTVSERIYNLHLDDSSHLTQMTHFTKRVRNHAVERGETK